MRDALTGGQQAPALASTSGSRCPGVTRPCQRPHNPPHTARPPSPQVDVFSFAVLCWEMLTGRVPWRELAGPMQARCALRSAGWQPASQGMRCRWQC